jgi:hypothetical protein
MNSIFVLKPVLDLIYEDAKRDREEIESLKKRIRELEEELKNKVQTEVDSEAVPNTIPNSIKGGEIDDSQYEAEASLPATSVPVSLKNEIVQEGETKTVQMINNMTKKEYMKEYQKNYRKKQKENKEIVMNV